LDRNDAIEFCGRWLPLWTGNQPDRLAEIYAEEAFYRDPANPAGIVGRQAIRVYLHKLLSRNPDWKWTADAVFPIEGGFVLRWKAEIPVGNRMVCETGLDLVLIENGKIARNEVYFDTASMIKAAVSLKA
jgi:hypothetical protein